MIKKIYSEENKSIVYAHKLMEEDYQILSETFQIPEEKIKNITNEEIFTPRISKSDWEIYKLYYPKIESNNKDEKYFWCEISPLVILKKEEKLTIIDENYFDEFHNFVEEYTKTNNEIEINKFLITMLHKVSQSLYKYVRFLIGEHDQIETILREQQSNEKLISLAEVEQGFYIYNIALRNLSFVIENLNEEPEFEKYDEYMVRILQEINFTTDLSSSYCEICKTTRETYSSYIGNNMNITMKFLAAATILITVPNMIFGFYGMNILLPFQNKGFATLAIITVIMIALMVILWKYMKKKILYLVAPILLITACTTSFGVGTGIGLGGGRSSVSVGTGVSTETKVKKDDKKVTDNKTKEKAKTTAKKPTPKKVVEQQTIKNNKVEATDTTEVTENTNKTDTTTKRVKQERQE